MDNNSGAGAEKPSAQPRFFQDGLEVFFGGKTSGRDSVRLANWPGPEDQ
jgi:hypothetical protein